MVSRVRGAQLAGVAVTAAGLLTAFLRSPSGSAVVGVRLLIVRRSRVAATLLLAGSAGLVTAYAMGRSRRDGERAGAVERRERPVQLSVVFTAAGLIAVSRAMSPAT